MFFIDAEKLRQKMFSAHFGTKDLARATGLSVATVQRILNGKDNTPKFVTIGKLARALNVPFDEILAV